jgi:hypothetical protein
MYLRPVIGHKWGFLEVLIDKNALFVQNGTFGSAAFYVWQLKRLFACAQTWLRFARPRRLCQSFMNIIKDCSSAPYTKIIKIS